VIVSLIIQVVVAIALYVTVERTWMMRIIYQDSDDSMDGSSPATDASTRAEYHALYGPVCKACNEPIDLDGDMEYGLCGLCLSAAFASSYDEMDN
jgi:hypothetical protein